MNPETAQLMKQAANGNLDAERFLIAWHDFAHLVDDLHDKDCQRTDEDMSEILVRFICELSGNQFYAQYRPMLLSLIVQSFNAWVDSNATKLPTERDVLKGFWHEVIYHVTFLTGGWHSMRTATKTHREYDYELDSQSILERKEVV